jgi:hypothetical protein
MMEKHLPEFSMSDQPQSNIDIAAKQPELSQEEVRTWLNPLRDRRDNPPSALLKPGSKISWMDHLHHVVGMVADEGERLFVLKYWIPRKQRWDYKVIMEVEYESMREWKTTQARRALEKLGTT